MTKSSLLERQSLEVGEPEEMDPLLAFEDIGDRAAEELGYTGLKRKIEEIKRSTAEKRNRTPLQKTLNDLGIKPFINKSVESYKVAALEKIRRPLQAAEDRAKLESRIYSFAGWGLIIGAFAGVVLAILGYLAVVNAMAVVPATAGLLFLGICSIFTSSCVYIPIMPWLGWRMIEVKGYAKEIPDFALLTMLKIKEALPSAQFIIEEFKADPFLIVRDAKESYYIEVWNEPGFKEEPLA